MYFLVLYWGLMALTERRPVSGGVAIRKTAHYTSVADLSVQSFNGIVGVEVSLVFTRRIAAGLRLLSRCQPPPCWWPLSVAGSKILPPRL